MTLTELAKKDAWLKSLYYDKDIDARFKKPLELAKKDLENVVFLNQQELLDYIKNNWSIKLQYLSNFTYCAILELVKTKLVCSKQSQ